MTTKCRILSLRSVYSFVVGSALPNRHTSGHNAAISNQNGFLLKIVILEISVQFSRFQTKAIKQYFMKNRKMIFLLGLIISCGFISCEKEDDGENKDMSSRYNENESHNAGQNCMSCHKSGSHAEGWFTVGGTVYNASKTTVYPNATIKLYTGPNETGTLVKSVEVDGKGNFYTTADINFTNGLYVSVTGTTGNTNKMASSITTGQCNSCHGSSTEKISAE